MLRVTADTNIYISALQFGGPPLRLLEIARQGRIALITSPAILREVAEVLRDKFRRSEADVEEAIGWLTHITQSVTPTKPIEVVNDDPDDNMVLECAVAADCDVIVSGDRHLLMLGIHDRIQIMKVAAFLEQLPQ